MENTPHSTCTIDGDGDVAFIIWRFGHQRFTAVTRSKHDQTSSDDILKIIIQFCKQFAGRVKDIDASWNFIASVCDVG